MPILGSFGAGSGRALGLTGCSGPKFVVASGGTEITCGDYKIHVFTGDGTLCVESAGKPGSNKVDYMVVAGGGGGGRGTGGGGGAGGFRESQDPAAAPLWTASPIASSTSLTCICTGAVPVTVGAGGIGANIPNPNNATQGSDSVFLSITSAGGGAGGSICGEPPCGSGVPSPLKDGGSGGGGSRLEPNFGSGNEPPTTPNQGFPGASGPNGTGGGGGGALDAGGPGNSGGDGASTAIAPNCYGECVSCSSFYAGGGGAGSDLKGGSVTGGEGGDGGGGRGGCRCGPLPSQGCSGATNTGGGGGGQGLPQPNAGNPGGSGIVVIRYKYQE